MYTTILQNENQNIDFARQFAKLIQLPFLIGFQGELGMGKSSLIRALLQTLGVSDKIKSPTYSLCEQYQTDIGSAAHLDCYRLGDFEELELIGFRDLLENPHLILIEWPEILLEEGIEFDLMIKLEVYGDGRRLIMQPETSKGAKLIDTLTNLDWANEC